MRNVFNMLLYMILALRALVVYNAIPCQTEFLHVCIYNVVFAIRRLVKLLTSWNKYKYNAFKMHSFEHDYMYIAVKLTTALSC